MLRAALASLMVVVFVGCASDNPVPRSSADAALFAPISMRIHPIFTQVKSWYGDEKPDGIEVLLEFQDQFGDPTKAAGNAIFELYSYRKTSADPRGDRVVNPWVGSLQTLADQQARWNRTSRTYFFQLEFPAVRVDRSYVLAATFDTGATRFFDEIVLEGVPKQPTSRATSQPIAPATMPATTQSAQPTIIRTSATSPASAASPAPATSPASTTSETSAPSRASPTSNVTSRP